MYTTRKSISLNTETTMLTPFVDHKSNCCACDKKCKVISLILFLLLIIIALTVVIVDGYFRYVLNDNPYSLAPTKHDALAGVFLLNKAYNLLSGQELYSQSGIDVITYQWDGRSTNAISGTVYEIPIEFQSVPNVIPSCDINTEVNDVYYSTSSSVLSEQSYKSSRGFSLSVVESVGFEARGIRVDAKTAITNSLLKGHSSTSISARKHTSTSYSWSFSMESLVTFYQAAINWNDKNNNFLWKPSYTQAIKNMNKNATNQSILSFFSQWGTHTLSAMQTGAYCKQTSYATSTSTQNQVYEFQSHVKSTSIDWLFFSYGSDSGDQNEHSGVWENTVQYTFSDIYCKGEIEVTSMCGGLTGKTNNPLVTSYILQPIWEINDIKEILSTDSLTNINLFIQHLFDSLVNCSEQFCNSHGFCTINQNVWSHNFINNWDGTDFSKLWNKTTIDEDNSYCFCEDGWYGNNCSQQSACDCQGKTGCCCREPQSTCDESLICNPQDSLCVNSNSASTLCGKYGTFLNCNAGVGGVITSVCGSGLNADCGSRSGQCASGSWNGIVCNYPQLGGYSGSMDSWSCASYGVNQECSNSINNGDLMIGICGSGENSDCKTECSGYAGILCASIDGISVNQTTCKWLAQKTFGFFQSCDNGYVATGYCGSGKDHNCDGNAFKIKCCRLNYGENLKINISKKIEN